MEMFFHSKPNAKGRRVCVAAVLDGTVMKVGAAMCHPRDSYNKERGRTIALGRARKRPEIELTNVGSRKEAFAAFRNLRSRIADNLLAI